MAVFKVTLSHYHEPEHFVDVYEFVAAAGNVGHEVHLIFTDAAIQYLLPEVNGAAQSSAKMIKSLPFYDVNSLWLVMANNHYIAPTQVPSCVTCVDVYPTLTFDYEVDF